MTLTDNIRKIQEKAVYVCELVDLDDYEKAHCAIDDIEAACSRLHRHVDHLQFVNQPSPFSVADNPEESPE